MNMHERIVAEIYKLIGSDTDGVEPTWVANALLKKYADEVRGPHAEYCTLEHFKQIAREVLRKRYYPTAEESDSDAYAGDLFSGQLQRRYPKKHKLGDDPVYVKLELLTDEDVQWNIHHLERSAEARLLHAQALRAWQEKRSPPPLAA